MKNGRQSLDDAVLFVFQLFLAFIYGKVVSRRKQSVFPRLSFLKNIFRFFFSREKIENNGNRTYEVGCLAETDAGHENVSQSLFHRYEIMATFFYEGRICVYKMFTPKTSAIYGKYFIRQKGFAAFGWSFFEREYVAEFQCNCVLRNRKRKETAVTQRNNVYFVVGKTGL